MYSYSPLLQAVFHSCERHPDKVAIIAGPQEITYGQLCLNIRKAASLIQAGGYKAGDTIRLRAVKEPHFIYMDFGAQMLGVIGEMIDPDSGEKAFDYTPEDIERMEPYSGEPEGLKDGDVIEILHTTGTTSKPKSVCLSHFNIFWAAKNTSDFVQNDEDDIEVIVMPVCHAFGLRRVHLTLMNGATAVLLPNFANVQLLFRTMEKYHVTTFGMAPAAWGYVRKISGTRISRFAGQLRHIEFGTAAMPIQGKKEVVELLPDTRICHNYGLTESNRSAMIEYHDTAHLDSVGTPIADNMKIRVIDGEICVRGNQTMVGYLDPEDNKEAFVDGFFRTGDCGYISDEGYIYLTGRAKEMISVGGKKVSPVEVEEAICRLGVGDCICVSHPDELLGEVVKAFILKGSTELSLEDIDRLMKESFPLFKCPALYEWIDEIPVNAMGKKQRRVLKGMNN